MSIEGQLHINLQQNQGEISCELSSSRPLHASQLFAGKPIDKALQILPMLFNICGKAQTIASLRAMESALPQALDPVIESQREALVWLENLRELLWRLFLDWPKSIDEVTDSIAVASITKQINALSQEINRNQSLLTRTPTVNVLAGGESWQALRHLIEVKVFVSTSEAWLENTFDIHAWAEQKQTQAARFVDWLQQKIWRHCGSSSIKMLERWDSDTLQQRLMDTRYFFAATPDWQGQAREVSSFNQQAQHPLIASLVHEQGNGIYTRVIARLVGVADLIDKLEGFFSGKNQTLVYVAKNGMAHVDAARGRLTHSVQLDGDVVKKLSILAPTEWNFHPEGVAAKGLQNLFSDDNEQLKQQANLLIHAIDPCVGYQLETKL